MANKPGPSAVATVANRIREDVFNMADGEFIGSEEDLIARYETSRPTLRLAAALLIQEKLMTARRGVGGGFFARHPDTAAVKHMAALYLRSRNVGLPELISMMVPIRIEIGRRATTNSDEEARQALIDFLEAERRRGDVLEFNSFIAAERQFNLLLARMSGSATCSLFLEILLDLSSMVHHEEDIYRNSTERLAIYRRARNRLADAILERDEELAGLAARRCAQLTSGWITENLEEGKARQDSETESP